MVVKEKEVEKKDESREIREALIKSFEIDEEKLAKINEKLQKRED